MPLDVTMGVGAVVFGIIAAAWFFDGYEARRQARALERDDKLHANWGIPPEFKAHRGSKPVQLRSRRKHGNAA